MAILPLTPLGSYNSDEKIMGQSFLIVQSTDSLSIIIFISHFEKPPNVIVENIQGYKLAHTHTHTKSHHVFCWC